MSQTWPPGLPGRVLLGRRGQLPVYITPGPAQPAPVGASYPSKLDDYSASPSLRPVG